VSGWKVSPDWVQISSTVIKGKYPILNRSIGEWMMLSKCKVYRQIILPIDLKMLYSNFISSNLLSKGECHEL